LLLRLSDFKEKEENMAIAAYIFIETMQGKAKTIAVKSERSPV